MGLRNWDQIQMLERRFFPIHRNINSEASKILSILFRSMSARKESFDILRCIFYDAKQRCLVSTDGRVIAWVSVDIPALEFIRPYLGDENLRLLFVKGSGLRGFVVDDKDCYVEWKRPLPDYEKLEQAKRPFSAYSSFFNGESASLMVDIGIPLNVGLLKKLRGFDWTVRFDRNSKDLPVVFKSVTGSGNEVFAAVMPLRMDLVRGEKR